MGTIVSKCFFSSKSLYNIEDVNIAVNSKSPESITTEISSKIENFRNSLNENISIDIIKNEINNLKLDILKIFEEQYININNNIKELNNRVSEELSNKECSNRKISFENIINENKILKEENNRIKQDYAMIITGSYSNQGFDMDSKS